MKKGEINNKDLVKAFDLVKQEAMPSRQFGLVLESKLEEKFMELYPQKVRSTSFFSMFRLRYVATMGFVLMFGVTTTYAYSSDKVVEGSVLYPLKRVVEQVEGTMAVTETDRISYYDKMAERRIKELEYLSTIGEAAEPSPQLLSTKLQAQTYIQQAEELSGRDEIELVEDNKYEMLRRRIVELENEESTRRRLRLENNQELEREDFERSSTTTSTRSELEGDGSETLREIEAEPDARRSAETINEDGLRSSTETRTETSVESSEATEHERGEAADSSTVDLSLDQGAPATELETRTTTEVRGGSSTDIEESDNEEDEEVTRTTR